jgi:hypothetical protein
MQIKDKVRTEDKTGDLTAALWAARTILGFLFCTGEGNSL